MENPPFEQGPPNPEPDPTIPVRIMIVEDEPGIGEMVNTMMTRGDNYAQSTIVEAAEQALEIMRQEKQKAPERKPFDLVISDMGLPGMNGVEFAAIVQKEQLADRFTIFTGDVPKVQEGNTPEQLEQKGVHNVIGKPARIAPLRAEVIRVRRAIQERSTSS